MESLSLRALVDWAFARSKEELVKEELVAEAYANFPSVAERLERSPK
jgi:hypothetical protein